MDSNTSKDENEKMILNDYVKFRDHVFCEENLHLYNPTPFYVEYDNSGLYKEDEMDDRDLIKFRGLYPESAIQIMEHVEDECDKLEYEGSMMFDEHPDRLMVQEMEERIYEKVKHLDGDVNANEVAAMNYYERRRRPPRDNWLNDMIQVMLFDEMYRRRCRYRRCRRRHY